MRHQMRVTLKSGDGILPEIVCVDHDLDEFGVKEVFEWDSVAALEGFQGEPMQLAEFDIDVLGIDEEGTFDWQAAVVPCAKCDSREHSLSGHRFALEPQDSGKVNPPVHNHGTEEGAGLACNERIVNGFRRGACLPDLESTDSSSEGADRG